MSLTPICCVIEMLIELIIRVNMVNDKRFTPNFLKRFNNLLIIIPSFVLKIFIKPEANAQNMPEEALSLPDIAV